MAIYQGFLYLYTMDVHNTGAKNALLIGLPTGLAVYALVAYLSSFYPFNLVLYAASLKIFWSPLSWLLIFGALGISLWYTGKKIAPSLKTMDPLKTSLRFTFWVNVRLMLVVALIYFYGIIATSLNGGEPFLPAVPYALFTLVVVFTLATLLASVTVSLLIVQLTKNKLNGSVQSKDASNTAQPS
jgi:hypothetical protein